MENLFPVCAGAFVAAGVNAVAGGGTFLMFPILTTTAKLSELAANVACTIGLWPGSASSVVAVQRDIRQLPRRIVAGYALLCLTGGAIGAELLEHTSEKTFHYFIPWLLLFATIVFLMGQRIARWAGREANSAARTAIQPGGRFLSGAFSSRLRFMAVISARALVF